VSGQGGDEGQEKSHDPTPARLLKARQEGDVAQSKEVNAAASYVGFYLAIVFASGPALTSLNAPLHEMLSQPHAISSHIFHSPAGQFTGDLILRMLPASALFLGLPALGVLASLLGQQAIVFSASKIKPKLSKISIAANAKKKFGPSGLVEFLKSAVKLLTIIAIFGFFFAQRFTELPAEALFPAQQIPEGILREALFFIGLITLFSIALAGIDLPWTIHQHTQKLKMTMEDLKKESKENEGDPELKRNRRQRAQDVATNKMLHDVPNASVIIVNPTHYAVALRWNRETREAPICVAKGVDEIAARIREIAERENIPIHDDPPTARAIFSTVKVGSVIERSHYAAVAAAIHFADDIRTKLKAAQ